MKSNLNQMHSYILSSSVLQKSHNDKAESRELGWQKGQQ